MKSVLKRFLLIYSLFLLYDISSCLKAEIEHYKDILIGGRASTMGGAYTAISDDASGSYYNPGGLGMAQGDSFSGSAKLYSSTKTVYEKTIGSYDWERSNSNLLANFFGVVKKNGNHVFAISYAVPTSSIEHQDQVYNNITNVATPIRTYSYNLHTEDTVDLVGPSYAYRLSENFSIGMTLYYYYRVNRHLFHYLIKFVSAPDEMLFQTQTFKENGLLPKVGLLWNVMDKFSIGMTIGKVYFISTKRLAQYDYLASGTNETHQFATIENEPKRETPYEVSMGVAYFYSPSLLFSGDLYYMRSNEDKEEDVINLAFGSEYYLTPSHALRVGLYTNNSNTQIVSSSTEGPLKHINMFGVTAGWTIFNKDSSITFGGSYSTGSGKSQPYASSNVQRDLKRSSWSIMTSADYGF